MGVTAAYYFLFYGTAFAIINLPMFMGMASATGSG